MRDTLIYVSEREYERLRSSAGAWRVPALGWWLSGFSAGIFAAVVLGLVR